jgi:5-methylcytosine-specific restriction endonuclease McrA
MLNLQTLVLNADFRPLSYNPLSLWSWRDAMTALMLDRVQLVANYDVQARSPSRAVPVPSVVALKRYKRLEGFPAFTRYNIYLRDTFSCQYCGDKFPSSRARATARRRGRTWSRPAHRAIRARPTAPRTRPA